MNIPEQIELIMLRQFNGEATAEENAVLQNWLRQNKIHQEEYRELLTLWGQKARDIRSPYLNHSYAWNRFVSQVAPTFRMGYDTGFLSWVKAIVIASSILIFVGGYAILIGHSKKKPIDWVQVNANLANHQIKLPDGSKIMLRKGSVLDYPADFGKTQRHVRLKGEAYFEVSHNDRLPFTVKTINGFATDMGTAFFIRSNDSVEQVIVSEGRVKFESSKNNKEQVLLMSGQKGELIGSRIIKSLAGQENYLSWENNRLVFNRTPLNQVAKDIYNYYGVRVRFAPEVNALNIELTAQFDHQPLDIVLEEIGARTNLLLKKEGDIVFVAQPEQKRVAPTPTDNSIKEIRKTVTQATEKPDTAPKKRKKKWWRFWR